MEISLIYWSLKITDLIKIKLNYNENWNKNAFQKNYKINK